jgi:hypothetical protein
MRETVGAAARAGERRAGVRRVREYDAREYDAREYDARENALSLAQPRGRVRQEHLAQVFDELLNGAVDLSAPQDERFWRALRRRRAHDFRLVRARLTESAWASGWWAESRMGARYRRWHAREHTQARTFLRRAPWYGIVLAEKCGALMSFMRCLREGGTGRLP